MKVTREQAAETRERILDTATRLFRERGFDGIGVADLMRAAGLTHGAFYGHFASKDDLIEQACRRALDNSIVGWRRRVEAAPDAPLKAVSDGYLSARHLDQPGTGCLLASVGSDIPRQPAAVRKAVTEGLRNSFDYLARLFPGRSKAARKDKAMAMYAAMVGGIVLARAVDDPKLAKDILRATAESLA
jgi:TetR/AcrR family transcriptional repressor of nem operon